MGVENIKQRQVKKTSPKCSARNLAAVQAHQYYFTLFPSKIPRTKTHHRP